MNEDPHPVAVRAALLARPLRFPFTRWVPRCWAHLLCGALLGPPLLVVLAALLVPPGPDWRGSPTGRPY
ncbi:hypothetical protein ACIRYZ_31900 [Kitasatospora sp. NPDC101155]|uniref:hypothetical protein n=1 Tax=Kitasatospora sp. NPDC101155 TaxID=3364097 RepID=UPI0037F22FF4